MEIRSLPSYELTATGDGTYQFRAFHFDLPTQTSLVTEEEQEVDDLMDNLQEQQELFAFDPVAKGLDKSFKLSSFVNLQGRDGKLTIEQITPMVDALKPEENAYTRSMTADKPRKAKRVKVGVGMDCSVSITRHGYMLIEATNFMYSFINEPYIMGKVACANVLSDLFAVGVDTCDTVQMILSVPIGMTETEQKVVIPLMVRGFKDCANKVGAKITGGNTLYNPWCFIGGTATTLSHPTGVILGDNAVVGDVLVLTKPLGVLVAINAFNWMRKSDRWNRIKLVISEDEVRKSYTRATDSMARLNTVAARLMHKYNAHGSTVIGAYGLLGHAKEFAKSQKSNVSFAIHNLPVLAKMGTVARACGNIFSLQQGICPELSGGLLISLPREQAASYCKEIEKEERCQAWIIGIVEKGNRTARIIEKPRIIEVPNKEKDIELW